MKTHFLGALLCHYRSSTAIEAARDLTSLLRRLCQSV